MLATPGDRATLALSVRSTLTNEAAMTWKQKLTERLAESLGFCVKGALLLDGIILALGSIYVTLKFAFFLVRYLDRVWFSHPW